MTREAMIQRDAAQYMSGISMSQDERQELIDWIDAGNSVYDNPWNIADESGRPMDYLTAIRVNDDLREGLAQQQNSGES